MKPILIFLSVMVLVSTVTSFGQSGGALKETLQNIVSKNDATVGVAISSSSGKDTFHINGDKHFPMQSVFKFHIGLAMLTEIDRGRFRLNERITIRKEELLPGLWSPIREKYPEGAKLTIREILSYTISQSDNVGCDVLLRLLGGPEEVERFVRKLGIEEISIKINEEVMQGNWERQFENWTTPKAANQILRLALENQNNLLKKESHRLLWKLMEETSTGINRIKGGLPQGTRVAHKTGWSGTNQKTGITAAVNDIGVVFLPDNDYYFISVFVTDSREDANTNEKIIADISRAVWNYFYLGTRE